MLLTINIMVDNALIIGDAPVRISAKIYNGNVCTDAPEQKNEIIKSSSEMMKTKSPAATSAGAKSGNTILKNVVRFVAPRSYDASSKLTSSSTNRLCKIGITYPSPKSVCPTINVVAPKETERNENKESNSALPGSRCASHSKVMNRKRSRYELGYRRKFTIGFIALVGHETIASAVKV